MTRWATGWYTVEAHRGGICIYFRTTTQRRGVRSAVEVALADHHADIVYIIRVSPGTYVRTQIAQVTSGGIWKWLGRPEGLPLREYIHIEEER